MKCRKLSDHARSDAATVKVQNLVPGEANSKKLQAWLSIIALGKKVQPKDSPAIEHKPALNDSHKLCFSKLFAAKHPNIVRRYAAATMRGKRKWSMALADEYPAKGYVNVDNLEHFREWMISARRFSSWAGVGVTGATVNRGEITRYGRHQA